MIGITWLDDHQGAKISILGASRQTSSAIMLNPIEVEALILQLCQSPWRIVDATPEEATRH